MLAQAALAVLSAAFMGLAIAQDATLVTDNPLGVVYEATLPVTPTSGDLKGSVAGITPIDKKGVKFTVKFENLPTEGGPFCEFLSPTEKASTLPERRLTLIAYHLHLNPTPDGNCASTLGHLDPFGRGSNPPCDASRPESCEVGDLSGKHGKVDTVPFSAQYIDYYASTKEGNAAFFGNRSFVIHYANGTRLACANFKKVADSIPSEYPSSNCTLHTPIGTEGVTPVPTGPVLGIAHTRQLSLSMVFSFAMAILFVGLG